MKCLNGEFLSDFCIKCCWQIICRTPCGELNKLYCAEIISEFWNVSKKKQNIDMHESIYTSYQ